MGMKGACGHSSVMHHSRATIKVFLADDSVMIRERVAAMLEAGAMSVVGEAATPQQAIEGILASTPDVVVLDAQLERGQGLEVLCAVRPVAPDIGFVVFSSNSGPAYRKRYLAEGAVAFLDKSTEFDQLVQTVKKASQHVTH
jgi:DNA-binding NarL/FixJ family response regulator